MQLAGPTPDIFPYNTLLAYHAWLNDFKALANVVTMMSAANISTLSPFRLVLCHRCALNMKLLYWLSLRVFTYSRLWLLLWPLLDDIIFILPNHEADTSLDVSGLFAHPVLNTGQYRHQLDYSTHLSNLDLTYLTLTINISHNWQSQIISSFNFTSSINAYFGSPFTLPHCDTSLNPGRP